MMLPKVCAGVDSVAVNPSTLMPFSGAGSTPARQHHPHLSFALPPAKSSASQAVPFQGGGR